ncbi:helix-turn-helix transcriptional regulator [Rhodobacteraceae bacterium R_SAG4]|nr:helix-turn-helix transcriptional regulator [Rhodobacteraceae bacterium R_SAG4]
MTRTVNGPTELSELITTRIQDISAHKSQKEIAEEVGFPSTNVLSIIKSGKTKLSLDRVDAMAKALEIDPQTLWMPALRQYYSEETISSIRQMFNSTETKTEREIISLARKHMDVSQSLSYSSREALKEVFTNNKPAGA